MWNVGAEVLFEVFTAGPFGNSMNCLNAFQATKWKTAGVLMKRQCLLTYPGEFFGRLPVIATLGELDESALVQILTEPKNALTKQYAKLLEMEGAQLEFRPEALKAIAAKALARKTGARGLRSILEGILLDTMFELPSLEGVSKVLIDEKVVQGETEPLLVYDNIETARVMPE